MTGSELDLKFIFNENTIKFKAVDLTPWPDLAADGVTPVVMTITGLGPTGVAFPAATVEINYTTSNFEEETGWFQLPKTNGAITPGAYVFTAVAEIDYDITGLAIESLTVNRIYLDGDYSFIIAGESVTVSGATNPANDGTYTVSASVYDEDSGQTYVVVNTVFVLESTTPAVLAYSENGKEISNEFAYTYSTCDQVSVAITSEVDCTANNGSGTLTVTDTTTIPNGQSVLNGTGTNTTKRISVTYPVGLVPAPSADPKTTYNSVLGISPIADTVGDQYPFVAVVVLDMQCIQDDGLYVWYTVRGQESIAVVCGTNLCNFQTCINNYITAYNTQLQKGVEQPANMAQLVLMNSYIQQYMVAQACADYTTMSAALTNLETLVGSECGCSDSTATAPSWLQETNGNLFQPDWQFNAYVPVWRNSREFDSTETALSEEAAAITVGQDLMANIGDQVNIYIEGYNSGGSGAVIVTNETTGVTYLNTGSLASGVAYQFHIQITRVDGDLTSWVMTRRTVTAGVVAYTTSNNPETSDWDLEGDNILNMEPQNANTQLAVVKVWVERETSQPE